MRLNFKKQTRDYAGAVCWHAYSIGEKFLACQPLYSDVLESGEESVIGLSRVQTHSRTGPERPLCITRLLVPSSSPELAAAAAVFLKTHGEALNADFRIAVRDLSWPFYASPVIWKVLF